MRKKMILCLALLLSVALLTACGQTQEVYPNQPRAPFTEAPQAETVTNTEITVNTSGSTVIDLSAAFMNSLSTGPHRFRFVYFDGKADGIFTVQRKIPVTGDTAQPLGWLLLILAGAGILARLLKKKKVR